MLIERTADPSTALGMTKVRSAAFLLLCGGESVTADPSTALGMTKGSRSAAFLLLCGGETSTALGMTRETAALRFESDAG
jgi:hypothetical protein